MPLQKSLNCNKHWSDREGQSGTNLQRHSNYSQEQQRPPNALHSGSCFLINFKVLTLTHVIFFRLCYGLKTNQVKPMFAKDKTVKIAIMWLDDELSSTQWGKQRNKPQSIDLYKDIQPSLHFSRLHLKFSFPTRWLRYFGFSFCVCFFCRASHFGVNTENTHCIKKYWVWFRPEEPLCNLSEIDLQTFCPNIFDLWVWQGRL